MKEQVIKVNNHQVYRNQNRLINVVDAKSGRILRTVMRPTTDKETATHIRKLASELNHKLRDNIAFKDELSVGPVADQTNLYLKYQGTPLLKIIEPLKMVPLYLQGQIVAKLAKKLSSLNTHQALINMAGHVKQTYGYNPQTRHITSFSRESSAAIIALFTAKINK